MNDFWFAQEDFGQARSELSEKVHGIFEQVIRESVSTFLSKSCLKSLCLKDLFVWSVRSLFFGKMITLDHHFTKNGS